MEKLSSAVINVEAKDDTAGDIRLELVKLCDKAGHESHFVANHSEGRFACVLSNLDPNTVEAVTVAIKRAMAGPYRYAEPHSNWAIIRRKRGL